MGSHDLAPATGTQCYYARRTHLDRGAMNRHFSRSVWQSVAVVLLALPVCAQQAAPARDTSPQTLDVQGGKIRVVTVASGLFHPWGIAFADANTVLVTEKNGALRLIRNGVLEPKPVWTSPTRRAGKGATRCTSSRCIRSSRDNQLVYVSYPKLGPKGSTLAVARGHLKGSSLGDVEEIFVADAWETGGNIAGRVYFGKDGMLYVTIGDRDRICCNAEQKRRGRIG